MIYKARRLPHHKGTAAWNAILGPQAAPQVLEGENTADIAIIGAGFAGLSAARRLVQLDDRLRIVVLDAGRVGEGAAGRNSGFMIDLPHELTSDNYAGGQDERQRIDLNRRAIAFAAAAVDEYGISRDYFDPVGKVNGAVGGAAQAHNTSYAAHLASLGEPYDMLDRQQMTELTGSGYYHSGLYTPGTVMLQPAGYVRGLAAGLVAQGVALFENSPVRAFAQAGQGWRVKTAKGSVQCAKIIVANNGHLESFGVEKGRLVQLFLFAAMTPALGPEALEGQPRWGVTPSDPMGTTMRRIDVAQGGNRIVTRTCAAVRPGMVVRDSDLARAARVMRQKFDARFPKLRGQHMEYTWAGHLCLSMNGVSVTREIDRGVFAACVQNGLGTARGTLTGIGAAELLYGETSTITRALAQEERPNRLPPRPLQDWGANAVLRWKELKARNE